MTPSADLGRTAVQAPAQRDPAARARRGPGALWLGVVAFLTLALAASLTAQSMAGAAIRLALVRSLGTGDIAITVRSWPAPALWWGNIGMLSVGARGVRAGRFDVAGFDMMLAGVAVDPVRLYGRRELVVRSVGSGFARVTVSAGNLAQLLETTPSVRRVAVRLRPGAIVLTGLVSLLGTEFPASVTGRLVVRDATRLDFAVDRVTVLDGLPVPPDVTSRLAASINPVLDIGQLPFGLRLTKVTIGEGVLTLHAVAGGPVLASRTP